MGVAVRLPSPASSSSSFSSFTLVFKNPASCAQADWKIWGEKFVEEEAGEGSRTATQSVHGSHLSPVLLVLSCSPSMRRSLEGPPPSSALLLRHSSVSAG